jgi:hypothetical protein
MDFNQNPLVTELNPNRKINSKITQTSKIYKCKITMSSSKYHIKFTIQWLPHLSDNISENKNFKIDISSIPQYLYLLIKQTKELININLLTKIIRRILS